MSKFEESEWKKQESAQEFIQNADYYILERKRSLKIMKSIYKHFLLNKSKYRPLKVMDIGCGDGILIGELLKVDENLEGTLIDGSPNMLQKAKERLKSYPQMKYIQKTFQELVKIDLNNNFNLVISSLAIHHLSLAQKESLFKYIYNHLHERGFFLNIDTVKAPSINLENWYLMLWKEWILEKEAGNEVIRSFSHIPDQYKNNPDNHPDTLKKQMNLLESIGFKNVDCYYKYGIFALFGGEK